ncbi:MAG: DNA repair protein RecN [Clostridia bacterium]|nr:DNA repair protein RecN [Clostridia bacterium]
MISHISIENFAIIKHLDLDLQPGLNILTGETGAGKSIIIEAISMALGSRADTDYIRTGEDKAVITLMADTDDCRVADILEELGLPDDNPLIIRREISAAGKSVCRINGQIAPISALSRLCRRIADIHGQYDHQSLLNPDSHIDILDLYGGSDIKTVRDMVSGLYANVVSTGSQLEHLKKLMADAERRRDFMRFELDEIESAAIMPGEDEKLEESIKLMQNSETIYQTLSAVYEGIFEGEDAAMDRMGTALSSLQNISEYSKDLEDLSQTFSDAYYAIEDMNRGLRRLRDSVSFSPEELDEAIARLDLIDKLKRKYGGSLEEIFAYRDKTAAELEKILGADDRIQELTGKLKMYSEQYDTAAARLTVLRKRAAQLLETEVNRELAELNFTDAELKADIAAGPAGAKGSDRIEFLIRTNRGESSKPLAKIASGGELSRIMLAMKRIIGDLDSIPTMIFDEIDAGISGRAAGAVGEKLKAIAKNHQVICITHLPQIAAGGDYHYRIEKTSDEYSTQTTIVPISEEERIEELARLLSGTSITETARDQAKELLKLAKLQ